VRVAETLPASETMTGVFLPGGRAVELREVRVPQPGPGQVLVRVLASTICGSDLRAIYREHLGEGAEAYRGVVAGHEPSGEIVEVGRDCRRFGVGERVILYHIAGCGICSDCRSGYMISCTSPRRAAYGWQRDGGHAPFLLAEESTCVALPDELSYVDGACVACGFGTAYEALCRASVSGRDDVLVTGLGPVGLAVGLLAQALGARRVVGTDAVAERLELARTIGAVHEAVPVSDATCEGAFDVAVDCSGSMSGRALAVESLRRWGRLVLVGEGGRFEVDASPVLIHNQLTVFGSWVTSIGRMEELAALLPRWGVSPETTVTHTFPLHEAAAAYALADEGRCGKVALLPGR
jgi:2-desacetyl-2-hydroxyethyl bacteriochlorophyllide A dehydrogenase